MFPKIPYPSAFVRISSHAHLVQEQQRTGVVVLSQNIPEERTAGRQHQFMSWDWLQVTTNQRHVEKVFFRSERIKNSRCIVLKINPLHTISFWHVWCWFQSVYIIKVEYWHIVRMCLQWHMGTTRTWFVSLSFWFDVVWYVIQSKEFDKR